MSAQNLIQVLRGGTSARNIIEEAIMGDISLQKYLQPFIDEIDSFVNSGRKNWEWFLAINNSNNRPNGLFSVKYEGDKSFLEGVWTDARSVDELKQTISELVKKWGKSKKNIRKLVVDIPPKLSLTNGFKKLNFEKSQTFLSIYYANTRIVENVIPEDIIIRQPERGELQAIYEQLIEKEITKNSPIYISKKEFLHFSERIEGFIKNSILATNEDNALLGFGCSFKSKKKKMATLFGPHSVTPKIEELILNEFITYWRINNIEKIQLIRNSSLPQHLIESLNFRFDSKNSLVRYVLNLNATS